MRRRCMGRERSSALFRVCAAQVAEVDFFDEVDESLRLQNEQIYTLGSRQAGVAALLELDMSREGAQWSTSDTQRS